MVWTYSAKVKSPNSYNETLIIRLYICRYFFTELEIALICTIFGRILVMKEQV